MILTHDPILSAIKAGDIKIDPFQFDAVESASYNVTLSNQIRLFIEGLNEIDVAEVAKDVNKINEITRVFEIPENGYYLLKPGELMLGMTVETVTLSTNIAGWLEGRSRFARMGLMVHVTACFLQPGISNKQVFEIFNASRNAIMIRPGVKIAQIIFERVEGKAQYHGAFTFQQQI
jgi:dCTP deaminase